MGFFVILPPVQGFADAPACRRIVILESCRLGKSCLGLLSWVRN
jgi:hypothetical protein